MGVEKRTQNWILVTIVLILAIAYPLWKVNNGEDAIKQGIDLVGGVDLLLEARLPVGSEEEEITADMIVGAITIVRNRLDPEGIKEIIIQQLGTNRIVVQIPGEDDPEQVKRLIGRTAVLRFIHAGDDPIPKGTRLRYIDAETGEPLEEYIDEEEVESEALQLFQDSVILKGIGIVGFGYPPIEPSDETEDESVEDETEMPLSVVEGEISIMLDTAQGVQLAVASTQNSGDHLALLVDNKVRSVMTITTPLTNNRIGFPGLADDPDFDMAGLNGWLEGLASDIAGWANPDQTAADALQNRVMVINSGEEIPEIGTIVEIVDPFGGGAPGAIPEGRMDINTNRIILTGDDFKDASVGWDPNTNQPQIDFTFKSGDRDYNPAQVFGRHTSRNVGKYLAIALDDIVISCPVIRTAILGGRGVISGDFTLEEVTEMVVKLDSGRLPVPLQIIENRTVGPILGEKSIADSKQAAILGAILVLLYMIAYYRFPGLLADLALIFYAIVFFGALSFLGATLTLPGIAGFILSLGMAVDANVIIFERLREELKTGKTFRSAVDAAFKRAFLAIFDANVTTLITGLVLYNLGTGPIRGFAVTLCLGILVSMFSALVFTRLLLETVLLSKTFHKYSLFGLKESDIALNPRGGGV